MIYYLKKIYELKYSYNEIQTDKFILPKKVTDLQKKEIIEAFMGGTSIKELSLTYQFTVNTIKRQLKQQIGEKQYNKIEKINSAKISEAKSFNDKLIDKSDFLLEHNKSEILNKKENLEDNKIDQFYEIEPLRVGVATEIQKDITSIPLEDIIFPNMVYMIIEKEIELKPKLLRDYPEWSFLPKEDLQRYTIEIFKDQKEARRNCSKNQKLLKVPNPNVFLIASKIMQSKGITRIVYGENLISI